MKTYRIPLLAFVSVLLCACDQKNAINGHEYVDLGLSVMWATCNIGADCPEEYGDYFAWGETEPKEEYTEENRKTLENSMGDIGGNASYDAARANWGGSWRRPTRKEFQELIDNCDWEWVRSKGEITGYRVTGKNGNSIFLPAAGHWDGASLNNIGEYGSYWSSTPDGGDTQIAFYLYFYNDHWGMLWDWRGRDIGRSVRPVSEF